MDNKVNDKIRFALIGCGTIANKHAIALNRFNDAEVVGGYDVDYHLGTTFAEKHSIPVFKSVEEMIEKTDPQVLSILTPSGKHAENILELIHFNRHFVVEKPLALRLDQIDRILKECDKMGLKLFVVQQNRFNPPIQKLKQALDKGRFGKLVLGTIRVRWSRNQDYYDQKS
ncbi:Gfo/Idh/MocA family oxidoreductase, partial [bacterium]|nr:Gfo/Idh/MocA family oxidoreductase [bacterium]